MNKDYYLQYLNKKPLTDRDVGLGLGYNRLALWESLGEDVFPFPKQMEILMCPAKEIYVCASRGSGKTYVAAIRAIEELLMPNRRVFVVAEQYKHCKYVFENIWHCFSQSELLKSKLVSRSFNVQNMSIKTNVGSRGSELVVLSGNDPDALVGMSADLVVIDEAAMLSDSAFYQVRPALNRKKHMGRLLAISSPRGDNWFKESYQYAETKFQEDPTNERPRLKAIKLHILDNPFSDHNEYYEKKKEAEEIGTPYRMAFFKREWEGEFDAVSGEVFAFTNDIFFPKNFYIPSPAENLTIGIDYARLYDFNVCTAFTNDLKMVGFDRWNHLGDDLNIERICKFIYSLWNKQRILKIYIDATGEGSGIPKEIERRMRELYGVTGLCIYGHKFTNSNKFELIEKLQMKLANEEIALWDLSCIREELANYRIEETTSHNYIYRGTKDDVISSLMLSVGHISDNRITVF
jgi:hypothetical protein